MMQSGQYADPVQEFNRQVEVRKAETGEDHRKAVAAVVKADPDLHRAFLAESNEKAGRHNVAQALQR